VAKPVVRPVGSLEYVNVRITEANGVTFSAGTVQIAFKSDESTPSGGDWLTGGWMEGPASVRTARILCGPGGTYVPTAGKYRVWYKFTDSPEIPARPAGWITFV
jgi:hypothetical protein